MEWPIVGRDEELAFIASRLTSGSPGVLLTGPSGTGKSRLAREALGRVVDVPAAVVVCTDATAGIPYAALSSLGSAGDHDRFESILYELRLRSHRTVLLIDDIDRLDRMSMAVVHQAVVEGLVFLMATLRTDAERTVDVVSLWKDLGLVRVEIQELSRHEVAEMLAGGLGGEIDGLTVKQIWEVSGGVPLYVRELAVASVGRGVLAEERGVWVLTGPLSAPDTLSDLVRLRLDGLGEEAQRTADLLGLGEMLPVDVVAALGSSRGLELLENAGVAEVSGDVARLAHPLYGEVVRSSLGGARRRSILASLADAVDGRLGGAELIRVTMWRLDAGSPGPPEMINRAAQAAYRMGDFELAMRLLRHAHEGGVPEASVLLGQLLHEVGEHQRAEEVNVAIEVGSLDDDLASRVVVQRAVNLFFGLGRGDEALTVLRDGPRGLPFNEAWFLVNMGRIADAAAVLPSQTSDLQTRSVTAAWIATLGGRPDEALGVLDAMSAPDLGADGAPSRFRDLPELPRALALTEAGRLDEARALADAMLERAIDGQPTFIRSWWLFTLGRIHTDLGLMRRAASLFRQGEALQASLNQPGLLRWYLGGAAYALAQTTARDEAARLVAAADAIGGRDEQAFAHLVDAARCWLMAQRDRRGAVGALVEMGDRSAGEGAGLAARRLWWDAVRLGGPGPVEDRLDADPQLGGYLDALRNEDAAAVDRCARGFANAGQALWAAEAHSAAAALHARAGVPREATSAARDADAARARCEDVDTPGLAIERGGTPLTDREREVVTLAARGMPSKEIAESLFVSVRTVNNLIQRAYVKLGVSSRSEAAVALGIATEE